MDYTNEYLNSMVQQFKEDVLWDRATMNQINEMVQVFQQRGRRGLRLSPAGMAKSQYTRVRRASSRILQITEKELRKRS